MIEFNYEYEYADKTIENVSVTLDSNASYIEDILMYFKKFLIMCGYSEEQVKKIEYNKNSKEETLIKIIKEIHRELSLLKSKECPDEEFKNIPYEIIEWIEELGIVNDKK
ncbi:MAG: hypothetical protein HFH45_03535 [Bacilli bacterium]|nr:hypothetical protein [Bacilli bacterium]